MKGSTSMPNMSPCTTITTNPTKVVKVPRDGGEHAIEGNMELKTMWKKKSLMKKPNTMT
jgi:hypothetical protein